MTGSVTNIIIAAAAVIGLVPLGVKATRDLLRNRRRRKTNEQLGTVLVSVFFSLIAPGVLESAGRHIDAVREALPDWVRAGIPDQPPASAQAPPSTNGSTPHQQEPNRAS